MSYPIGVLRQYAGAELPCVNINSSTRKEPRCPSCGGNISYDATKRERTKKDTCYCDGYHYPHYRGTEPWCVEAKNGPTDADWEEIQR